LTEGAGGIKPDDPRVEMAQARTGMAGYRTQLALDRTMLAWIRTTLTMAGFGFGLVGFFRSVNEHNTTPATLRLQWGATFFGFGLIVLAILAMVLAGFSQWRNLRRLSRGESPEITHWPLSITVAMLFALLGLAGLFLLFLT